MLHTFFLLNNVNLLQILAPHLPFQLILYSIVHRNWINEDSGPFGYDGAARVTGYVLNPKSTAVPSLLAHQNNNLGGAASSGFKKLALQKLTEPLFNPLIC